MSIKNTCVLLYSSHQNLERDFSLLRAQSFNMKTVSIIGKGQLHKDLATGLYISRGQVHYQGNQAQFWNGLWANLNGAGFFSIPGIGVLLAAGPIAYSLAKEHGNIEVGNNLSVLGFTLFNIGIPINSIRYYEKSVNSEKLLLIIHGLRSDVERVCQLLHSPTQQVTMHMA